MIDWFNAHGGVAGYKVDAVYADAQSKPDVAINEAVRLIEQEKVDMLLGFYSSAECVPAAARIEEFKKFMWITTCIASPVLAGRDLKYVFRANPYGQQWGHASTAMVDAYAKAQLGKDSKDLKVAIIHEDGPYGTDVAKGDVDGSAKYGFQVVDNEGYSASAPDLSSMVTKLKRSAPDIIVGTAASNTFVFLTDVLPRAIKKYGGIASDDLRQAALDTDIPDGGTMLGFGVKFETPGMPMAGQNDRAYPVIVQYSDDKSYVVWPKAMQQREPVLKLPSNSPYATN